MGNENTGVCRWGFLSTASIGHKNWQAIKNSGNGVVAAVASRDPKKSQAFIDYCSQHTPFDESPRSLGSYDALIADANVDAIYIPLPTGMRKEWVVRAAEAGKHVMCEKPCAVTAADLKTMTDACEKNGVQFMDGVMYMHSQRMDAMRKTLEAPNCVGDFKRITSQFSFCAPDEFKESNIRTDSRLEPQGCLGDLGWYTIRFSLWAMNYQMPTHVCGRILSELKRPDSPESVPMEFSGEMYFEGGISAGIYNSFLTEHQQWANISGTKGNFHVFDFVLPYAGDELKYQLTHAAFVTKGCDFQMENKTQHFTIREGANSTADSQESNLFRRFGELALSGKPDLHWPEISLKTQIVMDALLESARNSNKEIAIKM